jgi:subtilase family protein/VCBS repeat protein
MLKRSGLSLLLALVISGSLGTLASQADFPEDPPNDPDYAPWETGQGGQSFYDEQWNLFSFTPRGVRVSQQASGISADLAWKVSIGRKDVIIAILDSGIDWRQPDLVNQIFLNRGELPEPQDASGHSTPGVYDLNGDGVFNIQDYAADPRVYDANGNGILDPGDLILIFSDGVDNDNNGYVDDIAGWDVYEDDNDPFDNVHFGHGTGRAKEAAAEGNNGIGRIGVAPGATLLPVRIGDSFVVDANSFAQGLLYAVDAGASVVAAAVGSYNNSRLAREAVRYAYQKGVVVVLSAADENAFHHNYPSAYDHAVAVKAIVPDSYLPPEEDQVAPVTTTFEQHSNCTNYGGRIDLSLPSVACSSGATAIGAGLAALIVSRGKDLVDQGLLTQPLSANEVKQLMTLTADDVFDPRAKHSARLYPSQVGWDQYFGYGRGNAKAALDRVAPGTIPPEADLSGPEWFQTLDPVKTPLVPIVGRVAAPRASSYRYIVEYGIGVEPMEESFVPILVSGPETAPIDGTLATWPIASFVAFATHVPTGPQDFAVTLRVRVIDENGQHGEARKSIFLHHDPDLRAGFPVNLGASGESSPALVDLDGDGTDEIVLATADGMVFALRGDGSLLPGWPVTTKLLAALDPDNPRNHLGAPAYGAGGVGTDFHVSIVSPVAVGDVDGDGAPTVIAADLEGKVYAWTVSGQPRSGFPVSTDPQFSKPEDRNPNNIVHPGIFAAPALGDIDGDGVRDIVVAAMDQHVYVWKGNGTLVPGWPVLARDLSEAEPQGARIISSPALGDLDGDHSLDVVVGTNEVYQQSGRVYAFRSDGTRLPGWPVTVPALSPEVLPLVGEGVPAAAALADVDGDGRLEVAIAAVTGPGFLFRADGSRFVTLASLAAQFGEASSATDGPTLFALASGAFGDLDGDGRLEYTAGTSGARYGLSLAVPGLRVPFEHHLSAWHAGNGAFVSAFPRVVEDAQFFVNPAIADLNGDGRPEVIAGTGGYLVHAIDRLGREPAGWPKFTGGWLIASAAVGDLDGNGLLEVVVNTREGNLYVWQTKGPTWVGDRPSVQWQKYHHDQWNTGNVHTPLPIRPPRLPSAVNSPGP